MDFNLKKELSNKICDLLGTSPNTYSKIGITHKDLFINKNIKIYFEEDGLEANFPLYLGKAGSILCLLFVGIWKDNLNIEHFETNCIFSFLDSNNKIDKLSPLIGFSYDYMNNEDDGILLNKFKNQWINLSLVQRLQLVLGLEKMVQEGVQWSEFSFDDFDELHANLAEILDLN